MGRPLIRAFSHNCRHDQAGTAGSPIAVQQALAGGNLFQESRIASAGQRQTRQLAEPKQPVTRGRGVGYDWSCTCMLSHQTDAWCWPNCHACSMEGDGEAVAVKSSYHGMKLSGLNGTVYVNAALCKRSDGRRGNYTAVLLQLGIRQNRGHSRYWIPAKRNWRQGGHKRGVVWHTFTLAAR
jgi:hypothetical protein